VSKLFGDTVKFGATVTLIEESTGEEKVWQIVGEPEAAVRQFSIALHDVRRDKAWLECYANAPAIRKEVRSSCHTNAAQVYGRKCPASERKIAKTGTHNT
jgi:hypothetical protein